MRSGGIGLAFVAAAACSAATPVWAERYAVVAVDAVLDGGAQALVAARATRAALRASGADVLDEEATRAPLRAHLSRGGAPLAAYQGRVAQSEAALAALEQEKAVQILETLVSDLVADQEPSVEKLALLEQSRLRLATRLIGLGGKRETGRAETEQGQQALRLLVDALRARPTLAPSKDEYPARFFGLLEQARTTVESQGQGGLHIDSRPRGATVYLEGRDVGRTPLVLGPDALARGEYRLWLAMGAARSVPMRVFVEPEPKPLLIDLAFDGALWPEGPGLRPVEGATIDEDVAKMVGSMLGADVLVMVGTSPADVVGEPTMWGAAFPVARARAVKRGVVPLPAGADLAAAAAELSRLLTSDGGGPAQAKDLPPSVLPAKTRKPGAPDAAAHADGELPWVPIAVGVGGVGAALLAAGAVVATVMLWPKNGAYTVTVTDLGASQ